MADGRVVINVKVNDREADNLTKTLRGVEKQGDKAGASIKNIGLGMLAFKGVEKIFQSIAASLDQAISRFDTLNRFPKMLELMGVEGHVADRSLRRLVEGIEGLPTRLDEVASTAQTMFNKMGNMDEATDLTLALNDAFLASGASSADASRGLQQFTQMLSTGKVDMQSWHTLQETMNYGLQKVAESFGYAGESAVQDFYVALSDGDVSMREFSLRLIELDKGVGGFAEMALENSKGIATSMQNIKTAVVNGVAGILTEFNLMSERITGKDIADNLDGFKTVIRDFFNGIRSGIILVEPLITLLYHAFKLVLDIAVELSPVLTTLLATILAYKAVTKVSGYIDTIRLSIMYLQEGATQSVPIIGALKTALTKLGGIKVVAFGLLAGAVVYLKNKFADLTDEQKELMQASEQTRKKLSALNDEYDAFISSANNSRNKVRETASGFRELARETVELSNKQNRSTQETKQLKENIDELNKYVGEGTVTFNEKKDAIDQTEESLFNYIEIAQGQDYINQLDRESLELQDKLLEYEQELLALEEERKALEEEASKASGTQKEKLLEEIAEVEEKQKESAQNYIDAGERLNEVDESRIVSQQHVADHEAKLAEERRQRIESGKIVLEDLSDYEQSLVEDAKSRYQSVAEANQNMWGKIEADTEMSLEQMKENLEHNQEVMSGWADNLQILADRGINQGFLDVMREAGPEYAGLVDEMVNADDEKLQELVSLWEKGGEDAPDLFKSAFDLNSDVIPKGVENLITDTESTFSDAIRGVDWNQYGGDITDGLAGGIKDGSTDVKDAITDLSDEDIEKTIKNKLEIRSPSGVMKRIGKFLMDGLSLGIETNKNLVMMSMTRLSNEMRMNTESMRTQIGGVYTRLTSDMTRHGINSGAGFRYGLQSQYGSIMSTARSIANSVSSTIRRSLSIHSPSRKLFELGSNTGEGFDLGLKAWVNKIQNTAKDMVDFDLPSYNASSAFFSAQKGRNATVETSSTINNSTTHNSPITVQFGDVNWSGKEDIRQTMEEIGFITEQENWRLAQS